MHPSRLNLSDRGPQGLILGGGSATGEISEAVNEEGLYAILESNADWLSRTLIHPHYDDLVLIFDGITPQDEQTLLRNLQVESQWSTKNEIRARRDLPPLTEEEGGDSIADPIWLQVLNFKNQMKMQEQQMQQYEQGSFGQPGAAAAAQGGAPAAAGAPAPTGATGAPVAAPQGA